MQIAHSSPLHRGDVDKHVLPAIGGLNESVALLGVEELHGTLSHIWPSFENADRRPWLHDHRAASVRIERCLGEGLCGAGSKNRQNIERGAYRRGWRNFQGRLPGGRDVIVGCCASIRSPSRRGIRFVSAVGGE